MTSPAGFQTRVRRQLRDDAMDAAYRMLISEGWPAVRMTTIAAAVGVSRQTLYKEFSAKEDIGRALVSREVERAIAQFNARLSSETSLRAAIEVTIRYGFELGSARRELIAGVAEAHGGDTLLPFVTTEAGDLIAGAAAVFAAVLNRHDPTLDPEDTAATCDAVVRLLLSHILQPHGDTEQAVRRLITLTHRSLGLTY